MKKNLIIAIDGPAASGKSTTAKSLAKIIGYTYIDTGAMYRAVALAVVNSGIDENDDDGLSVLLNNIVLEFRTIDGEQAIFLDGENVSSRIRKADITRLSSDISQRKSVREKLVAMQQRMGENGGIIMDGRDIGTVVFRNADVKIFLTASVKTRADRRWNEFPGLGKTREEIEQELVWRDTNDSSRELAPLKKAEDAVEIDTSEMSIEQQVNRIYEIIVSQL